MIETAALARVLVAPRPAPRTHATGGPRRRKALRHHLRRLRMLLARPGRPVRT